MYFTNISELQTLVKIPPLYIKQCHLQKREKKGEREILFLQLHLNSRSYGLWCLVFMLFEGFC